MNNEQNAPMEYFPGTTGCRIKAGWHEADKKGVIYGAVVVDGRKWAVVMWYGEDEPELFKAEGLEVAGQVWAPLS